MDVRGEIRGVLGVFVTPHVILTNKYGYMFGILNSYDDACCR